MILSEFLTTLKNQTNYINNSLYLKSYDEYGCTYKLLNKISDTSSVRQEFFIEFDVAESNLDILNRTVVSYIEVCPPK